MAACDSRSRDGVFDGRRLRDWRGVRDRDDGGCGGLDWDRGRGPSGRRLRSAWSGFAGGRGWTARRRLGELDGAGRWRRGPRGAAGDAAAPSATRDAATGPLSDHAGRLSWHELRGDGLRCRRWRLGPILAFADGSTLTWDGTSPARRSCPRTFSRPRHTDTVWVHYDETHTVVCPFCGAYTTRTLRDPRRPTAGKVRFFDQQGDVLPNLTRRPDHGYFREPRRRKSSAARSRPTSGCYSFLRSEFDQQLGDHAAADDPRRDADQGHRPQREIPGHLGVQHRDLRPACTDCTDGPAVASDTGFVARSLGAVASAAAQADSGNQPLALWTSRGDWFKQPAR